mmetsp:Transcript_7658/g.9492  ORF Transcript_7658/g.9492 Transcript_7658/m.9492 type:complete len:129 (-) Transcript_7658:326-712(-)
MCSHTYKYRPFSSGENSINLIDAPGRKKFVKNKMASLFLADHAILVVSASSIEDPLVEDVLIQDLICCRVLGVQKILVIINKLDLFHPHSETVFERLSNELQSLFKRAGCRKSRTNHSSLHIERSKFC